MKDFSLMNELINTLSDEPFRYGKSDCYIFTAKLVKAWHGLNYLEHHNVYKNKKEAEEYMEAFGGIEKLTTGTLGYSVSPLDCRDGDVVTAEVAKDEIALGFVFNGTAFFKGPKRVFKVPLKKCRKGWRIM